MWFLEKRLSLQHILPLRVREMVLWFQHGVAELHDQCFFLGVAVFFLFYFYFEQIAVGNSFIGYICGITKKAAASVESNLGCFCLHFFLCRRHW